MRAVMFFRWLFLLPVSLLFTALSYPMAPIVVLFVTDDDHLPKWLCWFDTPDNPLDGDGGWVSEHWQFRYKLPPYLARYVGRVGWLWRNSGYGFKRSVLGARISPRHLLIVRGDDRVSNRPLFDGAVFRTLLNVDGSTYWQWYYVKAWSKTRCIRINIGWKLWSDLVPGSIRPFVLSANPFMGFSK